MKARLALFALLTAAAAWAQDGDTDVLTAHDDRGNISTVYNLFDGARHAIQVARLSPQGGVQWTMDHSDGYWEKANGAAMGPDGSLYVSGVRRSDRLRYFLTLKFDANGYLAWETQDNEPGCESVGVVVDSLGNSITAGVCKRGQNFPVRVVKYNEYGSRLWSQEYDRGGRNYVRAIQMGLDGSFQMTVEAILGNYRDGSYETRLVTLNEYGGIQEIR